MQWVGNVKFRIIDKFSARLSIKFNFIVDELPLTQCENDDYMKEATPFSNNMTTNLEQEIWSFKSRNDVSNQSNDATDIYFEDFNDPNCPDLPNVSPNIM